MLIPLSSLVVHCKIYFFFNLVLPYNNMKFIFSAAVYISCCNTVSVQLRF